LPDHDSAAVVAGLGTLKPRKKLATSNCTTVASSGNGEFFGVTIDVARFERGLYALILCVSTAVAGCADEGRAPTLEPIEDQIVAVGQELVINLRATDPDGSSLEYGFDAPIDSLTQRASISMRPDGTGVFRWTPLGADVGTWFVDFSASDGRLRDTVTAAIDVRTAVGSAPIFREPLGSGTTLDLRHRACLDLDVVVEDQDDAWVELGHAEPIIAGSELVQEAGLSGVWSWCPSKEQLVDDRFPLVLTADDGTNPTVTKNYLIVLRHDTRNCPGEGPVVTHQPADDVSTVLDLRITAQISDDVGLGHPPLLYWSTVEPKVPVDFSLLEQVEMELESGDLLSGTWTGRIPNPVAMQGEGARADVFYVISATDADDPKGGCNHTTDLPVEGAFRTTVTNPGGYGGAGMCEPCSADVQCGGADELCGPVGQMGDTFCLEACESNLDCDDGTACVSVMSIGGVLGKQCVPTDGVCSSSGETCEADAFEPNDSKAQADQNPALATGLHEGLTMCAAGGSPADDWYRIEVGSEGTVGALAEAASAATTLHLGLYDAAGNPVDVAQGAGPSKVVETCVGAGTYYLRVSTPGNSSVTYDLLYERTPGSCTSACVDDQFEPNDSMNQATYADVWPNPFEAEGLMICSGNEDWFEVELYTGETVVVDLTFTQTNASEDLDLHFHDPDGVDLTPCTEQEPWLCSAAQGQSGTSNEHYEHTIDQAGCLPCSFYVRVRGWNGAENDYDLKIAIQ
jgi:hypothetical protein